jgi:hypothetical protein
LGLYMGLFGFLFLYYFLFKMRFRIEELEKNYLEKRMEDA